MSSAKKKERIIIIKRRKKRNESKWEEKLTTGRISNGKISSGPPVVKCKSDINSVLMNGLAMAKA